MGYNFQGPKHTRGLVTKSGSYEECILPIYSLYRFEKIVIKRVYIIIIVIKKKTIKGTVSLYIPSDICLNETRESVTDN